MRSSSLTSLYEKILGNCVMLLMLASVFERAFSSVPFFGHMIDSVLSSDLSDVLELVGSF